MIPKMKPMKAPMAIVRAGFGWVWTGCRAARTTVGRVRARIGDLWSALCTVILSYESRL